MPSVLRTTLLTSVGSALEYYDFVVFIMLASLLSQQFFPAHHPYIGLLETLAVFGVGYVVRPLGGLVFGILGDRYGRKQTFLLTIVLMAFSTAAIGCLPNYHQAGLIAPLLLISLRLLQGLAQGGELPGAITFISEHAVDGRKGRGFYCSLMLMGVALGATLSGLAIAVLTHTLSLAALHSYGWRIPFWLGGLLAVVGYWLRRKTTETPLFKRVSKRARNPLWQVLRYHPLQVVQGIALVLFPASLILLAMVLPDYVHRYFGYSVASAYWPLTASFLWSALLVPFLGALSDRLTRKRMMLIGLVVSLAFIVDLFHVLQLRHLWALWVFLLLYETLVSWFAATYLALLAELFPTEVRYTGVALSYNLTYCLAGFIPLLVSVLNHRFHSANAVILLLMTLAIISLVATLCNRDRSRVALWETSV